MKDKIFLDSNLWVYLIAKQDDNHKISTLENLIKEKADKIIISCQVLNELFNVLTKKKLKTKEEAKGVIEQISELFPVSSLRLETTKRAIDLHVETAYSFYDCMIIASALENECETLYSEDFQNGHVLQGKSLTIVNPFV